MKTRPISEHKLVLVQQEELFDEVALLIGQFKDKYLFAPETSVDLSEDVVSQKKNLEMLILECKQECKHQTDNIELLSQYKIQYEDYVGVLEQDKSGNIHCDNIMVSWKFCKNLVGCTVKLSNISLNIRDISREAYPVYASHVEVIAYPEEGLKELDVAICPKTQNEAELVIPMEKMNEAEVIIPSKLKDEVVEIIPQDITNKESVEVIIREKQEDSPDTNSKEMDIEYGLESTFEVFEALYKRMNTLREHTKEHKQICQKMDLENIEIQESLPDLAFYEGLEGVLKRDESENIHLGDCLVSYNYANNLVGKKVRISLVTVNANGKARYPYFAKHIEVIDDENRQ